MTLTMTRTEAAKAHEMSGGYLIHAGQHGMWIVLDGDPQSVASDACGMRDANAYGVNLYSVTEEQWAEAGWDESRLPGYDGSE